MFHMVVKLSLSHHGAAEFYPWLYHPVSFTCSGDPGRKHERTKVVGCLMPFCQICIIFFALDWPWSSTGHFVCGKEWISLWKLSLAPCVPLWFLNGKKKCFLNDNQIYWRVLYFLTGSFSSALQILAISKVF